MQAAVNDQSEPGEREVAGKQNRTTTMMGHALILGAIRRPVSLYVL
jgi:hypothetical protein